MSAWTWIVDRDFWSDIGIPTIGAAATVAAVVAAAITSRQALRIAKASDDRAERDSALRSAAAQARLLIDYAHLKRRVPSMPYLTLVQDGGESTVSRAYREVRAAMLISDVPGAEIVFALTEHDLDHAWRYPMTASDLAQHYADMWERRTDARVAQWARDPWGQLLSLEAELGRAQQDPQGYAQVDLGHGWENVYTTAQLTGE